ncbi:DUF4380 domain-containing protein [Pseudoteredinibacter isoporae]|uniref:DUF4380 domain-containing protein n=1 Tax=Pseudoteredinibacter isoporae TaxID=570281 RepID=UPI003103A1CB
MKYVPPLCLTAVLCLIAIGTKAEAPARILNGEQLRVEILPAQGARVSSLTWRGQEILYRPENTETSNNWGSTFWISPQSLWGWPPVSRFDSDAYIELDRSAQSVRLRSQEAMSLVVEKTLTLDAEYGNQILMNYDIHAQATTPRIAAWEVSRFKRQGLAVFKARPGSIKTIMGTVDYTSTPDGLVLVDFSQASHEGKLIGNSVNGWLAWFNAGLLYIKRYEPVPLDELATGEGDVEIYISSTAPYMELEVQSAARSLDKGQTLGFTVRWLLCDVSNRAWSANNSQLLLRTIEQCLSGELNE